METPRLEYRHGLIALKHVREAPPFMQYDARTDGWTAPGHFLGEARAWAAQHGVVDGTLTTVGDDVILFDPRVPRDYQREAVDRWHAAGRRGSVVLPTGSGKSFVAIVAIHESGARACIVAPTRALVQQWYVQLADAFGSERVGAWYGDEKQIADITVTTYHSLFPLVERHGARFSTLVLDEAHHLADTTTGMASAWLDGISIAPSPARLALTATYPEESDAGIRRLIGPVVYRRSVGEMADAELAAFASDRRFVRLTDAERREYEQCDVAYRSFFEAQGYRDRAADRTGAWKAFMADTRKVPAARRAYHAFRERERIIALPRAKLQETARLLRLFPNETALIFCGSTDAAERVSRRFAIPMITANTPASERRQLLDEIGAGRIHAVASVRVLDEGWDVPSAKLGIVLGDSTKGSRRQHAQRLGRLLRRQGERVASLFEIVVADTHEFYTAQRRGAAVPRPEPQLGLGF